MIPAPNVVAGIMIGLASTGWFETLGGSALWPLVFCAYVSITDSARRDATVAGFAERGHHLFLRSAVLTFYGIEFLTALSTALPVAVLTHLVKRFVT